MLKKPLANVETPKRNTLPPGPDWTSKVVKDSRQNRTHWLSPIRRIEFKWYKQACVFEEMRKMYDNDEVRAWTEFRRVTAGVEQVMVVDPFQYDEQGSSTTLLPGQRNPPPGPGWTASAVTEAVGTHRCYWRSPVRKIEFRKYKPACAFEKLREQFGADEIQAWAQYRKMTVGKDTYVVAPFQYDETTIGSSRNPPPPGPDWTSKVAKDSWQNRTHWLSPIRRIEFSWYKQACVFEELRKKHDNDEVRAWTEFRRITTGKKIYVVSFLQYDVQSESRSNPPPPGPNWTPKFVKKAGRIRRHWISPIQRIEFKTHEEACKFEELRRLCNNDEVQAWNDYRRITVESERIQVVSPLQNDDPSSLNLPRGRGRNGQRAPKPNGEIDVYTRGRHGSVSIAASSYEPEQKMKRVIRAQGQRVVTKMTVANRSSIRIGSLSSTKNKNRATKSNKKGATTATSSRLSPSCDVQRLVDPLPALIMHRRQELLGANTGSIASSPIKRATVTIDQKWAQTLVGLRMKVPGNWWNGCNDKALYAGRIASINFSDDTKCYFILELDTGETYPMRYDAVRCYADKEHPTNTSFYLPEEPPGDPNATRPGKRECSERPDRSVSKSRKLQKTSHESATQLPNASTKSKSKNSPAINSSKNRCSSRAPSSLHDEDIPPSMVRRRREKLDAVAGSMALSSSMKETMIASKPAVSNPTLSRFREMSPILGSEPLNQAGQTSESDDDEEEFQLPDLDECNNTEEKRASMRNNSSKSKKNALPVLQEATKEQVSKRNKKAASHKPVTIDQKWAQSLVGLRMKVPGNWWNGCDDKALYAGRIARTNFSDDTKCYFILELDTGETYPMRYDAVRCYADKEHPTNTSFYLPEEPPGDPNATRLQEATKEQVSKRNKRAASHKPVTIDQKWAQTLVGLRMNVPGNWWNGCDDKALYAGRIASINFSDDTKCYFILELDTGETYPMRYDAVRCYADKEHPTNTSFYLPEEPPGDPNATRPGKRECSERPDRSVSKSRKLQKTSHESATQLPNASTKSKSKNSPAINSSKNRCSSRAPSSLHDEDIPPSMVRRRREKLDAVAGSMALSSSMKETMIASKPAVSNPTLSRFREMSPILGSEPLNQAGQTSESDDDEEEFQLPDLDECNNTEEKRASMRNNSSKSKKNALPVLQEATKEQVSKRNKKAASHKPVTIDQKWAQSLVGLRMKVPGNWWNGCDDKALYAGRIARTNFSDDTKCYFILELDTGETYPMRYDAVRCYADKEHPTNTSFYLPEEPPGDPNATRPVQKECSEKLGRGVSKSKRLQKTSHEEERPGDPNATRPGKKECSERPDRSVSKSKMLQKTSHESATQLPKASTKSKSKNSPAINSSKNRRSSLAHSSLHDEDDFFDRSSEPTFDDGLNS
ncbi:LOW QUALITY PROTEIN: hypothetical protein ACHAXA_011702, partial [Cyclostephanos tholiformis]